MFSCVLYRKYSPVRRSPSYNSLLGKFLLIGPNYATWRSRCGHAPCMQPPLAGCAGWLLVVDSTPCADGAGMASTEARRECETEGCSKDAKLQCPTCIKLGIQGSYFCSQVLLLSRFVCFKCELVPRAGALCFITRLLTDKLGSCVYVNLLVKRNFLWTLRMLISCIVAHRLVAINNATSDCNWCYLLTTRPRANA